VFSASGAQSVPLASLGTPVGGQSFDMYGMVNSLYNHGAGTGTIHTRVGNYLVRMSAQAPTPNTITSGLFFGFVEDWPTPPAYGGSMASEELTSPYINFSADWINANQIEKVFMVLDNIFGYLVAPDAVNSQGSVYLTEMLRILDQWEANAPNASREYILYSPWHYLRQSGVTIPPTTMPSGAITEPGHLEWYQATLVDYQAWSDSLLAMMQAARPTLNITMHKVGMALCTAHRDIPAIHAMDIADLFFDIAHGKPSWYLMAAIAEYICLFGEKPAADLVIDPAWGIHPTVEANYQVIVDHMWGVLNP